MVPPDAVQHDFEIGELVMLKSGGLRMVVEALLSDGEHLTCKWFSNDRLLQSEFHYKTLVRAKTEAVNDYLTHVYAARPSCLEAEEDLS